MAKFRDNKGREWTLSVDVPIARRVKRALDVNICVVQEDHPENCLAKLGADPILMVEVLWMLCEEQAAREGVDPDDFGAALTGQAMGDATDAFVEALLDFSPPRQAKALGMVMDATKSLQTLVTRMGATRIPALLKSMEALIPGDTSPDAKESSATSAAQG